VTTTTSSSSSVSSPTLVIPALAAPAHLSVCVIALLLLFDDIDDFIGDAEIFDLPTTVRLAIHAALIGLDRSTYIVPPHVYLWYSEEPVAVWTCLDYFFQDEIHPGVAADEMSV
jgi:hypothetical protein